MKDLIIRKSDVENFGRKTMKKVYEFLHDDYILTFEEMKVEKDKLEKDLLEFYFDMDKFKDEKNQKVIKGCLKEGEYEKYLTVIECKIKDKSFDIDLIFRVLDRIKLDFEIDEDIYCMKKAFINIYNVYYYNYTYLKY